MRKDPRKHTHFSRLSEAVHRERRKEIVEIESEMRRLGTRFGTLFQTNLSGCTNADAAAIYD
jgi:hypothetical protein